MAVEVLPPMFGEMVTMTCEASINGERIQVRQAVVRAVYDDPEILKHIEEGLRMELGIAIVKKWKPKITVT